MLLGEPPDAFVLRRADAQAALNLVTTAPHWEKPDPVIAWRLTLKGLRNGCSAGGMSD
jgi:hypothetical protein